MRKRFLLVLVCSHILCRSSMPVVWLKEDKEEACWVQLWLQQPDGWGNKVSNVRTQMCGVRSQSPAGRFDGVSLYHTIQPYVQVQMWTAQWAAQNHLYAHHFFVLRRRRVLPTIVFLVAT